MKRDGEMIKDGKDSSAKEPWLGGTRGRRKVKSGHVDQRVEGTSVAMLWLAPFSRRKRTTSRWFSWAAMYNGVKPFCKPERTHFPPETAGKSAGNKDLTGKAALGSLS